MRTRLLALVVGTFHVLFRAKGEDDGGMYAFLSWEVVVVKPSSENTAASNGDGGSSIRVEV
jgi:hypothetical protein